MSFLTKIVGLTIKRIETNLTSTIFINQLSDYKISLAITIVFENFILMIYNPFQIKGFPDKQLSDLIGLSIESCEDFSTEIILVLDNNVKLIVDLREESFNGPEAMALHGPNNFIVVWN